MAGPKQTLSEQLRQRRTALSAPEVATLLQVSREAVYRYAQRQILPCLRFGDFLRFDPHELADWLDDRQRPAVLVDAPRSFGRRELPTETLPQRGPVSERSTPRAACDGRVLGDAQQGEHEL